MENPNPEKKSYIFPFPSIPLPHPHPLPPKEWKNPGFLDGFADTDWFLVSFYSPLV